MQPPEHPNCHNDLSSMTPAVKSKLMLTLVSSQLLATVHLRLLDIWRMDPWERTALDIIELPEVER